MRRRTVTAIILTILALTTPVSSSAAQGFAPAGGAEQGRDPVQRQLDEMAERASQFRTRAQRLRDRAASLEQTARQTVAKERERLNRLQSTRARLQAEHKRAEARVKEARRAKEAARARQREFENEASKPGAAQREKLARAYERGHRDEIARRREAMERAHGKYIAAQEAYTNFCNDPDASSAVRQAAREHMLRMQAEYETARRAYEEINPSGADGDLDKSTRQRAELRRRAREAERQAAQAEAEEQAADARKTEIERKLAELSNEIDAARRKISSAQKQLERAEQLRDEASRLNREAERLETEHQRQAKAHETAKARAAAARDAEHESDRARRTKTVEQDLDIGGRDEMDDVRIDDIRRRLWKKLSDSNDAVLNNIGRAMGAKQTGEKMRTAVGFYSNLRMAKTLAVDFIKNWNWDDVRSEMSILDHGAIYGKMTILFNVKTGQYVAIFQIHFPTYKETPLRPGIEPDKPYTVTVHGDVTLIGRRR